MLWAIVWLVFLLDGKLINSIRRNFAPPEECFFIQANSFVYSMPTQKLQWITVSKRVFFLRGAGEQTHWGVWRHKFGKKFSMLAKGCQIMLCTPCWVDMDCLRVSCSMLQLKVCCSRRRKQRNTQMGLKRQWFLFCGICKHNLLSILYSKNKSQKYCNRWARSKHKGNSRNVRPINYPLRVCLFLRHLIL